MFINYTKEKYGKDVQGQHNIMVFVGNGFDISILNKYRKDKLITSYSKFYDFLCYKGYNSDNILVEKMKKDKKNQKDNWSDFENSIGELLNLGCNNSNLDEALKELQDMFLLFLNELVNPSLLMEINKDAENNGWAKKALSSFLGDLESSDLDKIKFPKKTQHKHMFNYLFVNFNYTPLFDNYIFLDKKQFEDEPYKTVDRNFVFYPYPNYKTKGSETTYYSYLITTLIHPHGYQSIPRSLLFGIEESGKYLKDYTKSYWAQNQQKYLRSINNANLFIIYGASLGKTDSWWWNSIASSLLNDEKESELIIYYYNCCKNKIDNIKEIFIDSCLKNFSEADILKLKNKIFIVLYEDPDTLNMFGFIEN